MGGGDGADPGRSIELVTHWLPSLRGERFLHEGKARRFGMNRDGGEEHTVIEDRIGVAHLQVDDAANTPQLRIAFFEAKHLLEDRAGDGELKLIARQFLAINGKNDQVDEGIVGFGDPDQGGAGTARVMERQAESIFALGCSVHDERCAAFFPHDGAEAKAGALEAEELGVAALNVLGSAGRLDRDGAADGQGAADDVAFDLCVGSRRPMVHSVGKPFAGRKVSSKRDGLASRLTTVTTVVQPPPSWTRGRHWASS